MRVAVLASGGKDSTLSLHHAIKDGYDVQCLVTMIPEREDSWMFHYPNIHLVDLFAEAVSIKLVKAETAGVKEEEVQDLKNVLTTLHINGVVSGAVASQYQKTRIDRICKELGLQSIAPLWHKDQLQLLEETVNLGFETMIVGVYAYGFDQGWLGRKIDSAAIDSLKDLNKKYGISLVGEGGEYETLVLDAPMFKKKIRIIQKEEIWQNQSGYLMVKKAELVDKIARNQV